MDDLKNLLAEFESHEMSNFSSGSYPPSKATTSFSIHRKPVYQKKIIKDDDICDFFSKISDIENLIFHELNQCLDGDLTQTSTTSVAILIKVCNSLLDIKKKQLEIKRITNFSNKKKNKSTYQSDCTTD